MAVLLVLVLVMTCPCLLLVSGLLVADTPGRRQAQSACSHLAAHPGNSCAVQYALIRTAQSQFSLSTFEAMRHLDVYDPRARVMQLRNDGDRITQRY